ncbi:MAG: GDSL-type esterase/lipase family protein, partial [Chloroflexota bacterium]
MCPHPTIPVAFAILMLAACNLSRIETPVMPVPPPVMTLPFNPAAGSPAATTISVEAAMPQTILFLGDSITQGWNLNAFLPGAINAGRSGDTSSQVIARYLQQYAGQQFDAIFIQVGINDIASGVSDEALRQNLATLTSWAQTSSQRVFVGSLLPVSQASFSPHVHRPLRLEARSFSCGEEK